MLITHDRLIKAKAKACVEQADQFKVLYPAGLEPTVENLMDAQANGLDALWAYHLLPAEGPGSQRAFALWCAEQVSHLNTDKRVVDCLSVVRRRVADPASVGDEELAAVQAAARAAGDAARAAAWAAVQAAARVVSWDAARAAAWAAAWAAAGDAAAAAAEAAAWDAQLACLSQLLLEAE